METLIDIYFNLVNYQYLILFFAVIIEGPIATVLAGFLIAQNLMNMYLAFPIIIISDLIGDAIYYALGRWGRDFWSRIFGLSKDKLADLEQYYTDHSGKTIITSKIAHGVGAAFLFAAGAAKMPLRKFLLYNAIGTIPKTFILLLIGYFFGQSFARIGKYFDYFAIFTVVAGMILLAAYLMTAKKLKKKTKI